MKRGWLAGAACMDNVDLRPTRVHVDPDNVFVNGVVRIGATLVGGLSAAAAHGAGFGDAHRI